MYGNGKKALGTYVTVPLPVLVMLAVGALVIVVPSPVPVLVVVPAPNTPPPARLVPVVVADAMSRDPVHAAPVGQHAMFFARSVVQNEPEVQQAPPKESRNVLHELKFRGQLSSRLRSSCCWGGEERVVLEMRRAAEVYGS